MIDEQTTFNSTSFPLRNNDSSSTTTQPRLISTTQALASLSTSPTSTSTFKTTKASIQSTASTTSRTQPTTTLSITKPTQSTIFNTSLPSQLTSSRLGNTQYKNYNFQHDTQYTNMTHLHKTLDLPRKLKPLVDLTAGTSNITIFSLNDRLDF